MNILRKNFVTSSLIVTRAQMRSMNDEGGRIAVSGENGWVYLDYHLALFGPSSLPKGAHSLQMANPPYGCDPNAYIGELSHSSSFSYASRKLPLTYSRLSMQCV